MKPNKAEELSACTAVTEVLPERVAAALFAEIKVLFGSRDSGALKGLWLTSAGSTAAL